MKVSQARRFKELERENGCLKKAVAELTLDKLVLKEALEGNLLSPARNLRCVEHLQGKLKISERRACGVIGQPRATQRRVLSLRDDEPSGPRSSPWQFDMGVTGTDG